MYVCTYISCKLHYWHNHGALCIYGLAAFLAIWKPYELEEFVMLATVFQPHYPNSSPKGMRCFFLRTLETSI